MPPNLLLPFEHPNVSQLLIQSLETVLINKIMTFHFRVRTNSMVTRRGTLHNIWQNMKDNGVYPNDKHCLIISHITSVGQQQHSNPMTVTSLLKCANSNKENIAPEDQQARPPYHLDYHQWTRPLTSSRSNSFHDQLYSDSTADDSAHLINFDSVSTPRTPVDTEEMVQCKNTDGNHRNTDGSHSNTSSLGSENAAKHVRSIRYCSFESEDLNMLPTQLQKELMKELIGEAPSCSDGQSKLVTELITGDSPLHSELGTGDSPDGSLHHLSFVDCEYLLREIEEEWILTQTDSHAFIPTQTDSRIPIPTQTDSRIPIPAQTDSRIPIPAQTCSHSISPQRNKNQTFSFDSPFWDCVPPTQDMLKYSNKTATPLPPNGPATPLPPNGPLLMNSKLSTKQSESSLELFGSSRQCSFNSKSLTRGSPNLFKAATPTIRKSINKRKLLIATPHPLINNHASFGIPEATSTPFVMRVDGRGTEKMKPDSNSSCTSLHSFDNGCGTRDDGCGTCDECGRQHSISSCMSPSIL